MDIYNSLDNKCCIWGTDATRIVQSGRHGYSIYSPRTSGQYEITVSSITSLKTIDLRQRAKLTTWLVNRRSQGDSVPTVTRDVIESALMDKTLSKSDRALRLLNYLSEERSYSCKPVTSLSDWTSPECRLQMMTMMAQSESIFINDFMQIVNLLKDDNLLDDRLCVTERGLLRLKLFDVQDNLRLMRIRNAVNSGDYQVNSTAVAENIILSEGCFLKDDDPIF
ncbi:MAG: flagellar biosynthesis anti-sigma factor FlgM [Candidatus Sedimenticola sp. PURPLELP]